MLPWYEFIVEKKHRNWSILLTHWFSMNKHTNKEAHKVIISFAFPLIILCFINHNIFKVYVLFYFFLFNEIQNFLIKLILIFMQLIKEYDPIFKIQRWWIILLNFIVLLINLNKKCDNLVTTSKIITSCKYLKTLNWKLKASYSRHYLPFHFLTYICAILNHMRSIQGGFHNLFPFSIMHPGSRLHWERTSKKTRCHCHCKIQYSFHNITFRSEISLKTFTITFFQ